VRTLRKLLLFLFSHRCLAVLRWDLHFLRVRLRNALTLQSRRVRRFVSTRQSPVFLNLGSGPRGVADAHWVNVDGFTDRNVHFLLDFSRPLPFADESFDGVFCEHVLEHLSEDDGLAVAREMNRILRPGGSARIVVPDAEVVMLRYFEQPAEMVARRGSGTETPMEIVNGYFRQRYEHQFLYDGPTLQALLSRAGFRRVSRVRFREAAICESIAIDDEKYEWESLYIEAQK
jgi:predicted SAM-dependent methyltransferase